MRLTRLSIAFIAVLLVLAFVAGCSGGPRVEDPDKALKEARALIADGKSEKKSSVARDKKFQEATNLYRAVASQYGNKPQGAQALFELGKFYETVVGHRNYREAHNQYTLLINKFDRPREVLSGWGYLPSEIDHVQELVKQAKVGQAKMAEAQDTVNSKHKLLGIINVYSIMDFLVRMTGSIPAFSYWFAIIIITLVVKLLITPLTKAQFKSMKEMQKIAPLVKQIQEKYKGDQQTIGTKTMELYKEHGINPFASCLPILIQMPVLLLLFHMVSIYQFRFTEGHFLWIGSALKHLYSIPVPFGQGGVVWLTAGNLAEPDLLLVVLYVISMYVSTKLSSVDPTQAEQQKMMSIMMPIMFAFIFAGYSSAFLLI